MIPAAGTPLADALLAARLCAIDRRLGGIVLRGGEADARDHVAETLRGALGPDVLMRRLPVAVDRDALVGGLDIGATLAGGRRVDAPGLLRSIAGGILVVPMAERMARATAGHLAAARDDGADFLTILHDDGVDDEKPPDSLGDRLAFQVDFSAHSAKPPDSAPQPSDPDESEALTALVKTASALGIDSPRAALLALRAARASAVFRGASALADADLILAARLVLAPRATRLPAVEDLRPDTPPDSPSAEPSDTGESRGGALDDIVLAAAIASLPKDVLARIAAGVGRPRARGGDGQGERRASPSRGRPVGTRTGLPRGGNRLALVETLRAAAPWQRLRGRDGRVQLRRDDLRVRRFQARAETVTIFAVDASGSSALARLAEAKGAVELLLAQAYVRREEVALIAFRGDGAELLLPPTRSLTRARRALAELPGGGGTPLGAGLDLALSVADAARAKGRTPAIIVLTDGRANVARGPQARTAAIDEAQRAAKAIAASGTAAIMIDISARPRREGADLAALMRARYLPLPNADAAAVHAAVAGVR